MATKKNTAETIESSIREKKQQLLDLQKIDSQIDEIMTLRGGLPLEVQDLEDEIAGYQARIVKLKAENNDLDTLLSKMKNDIELAKAAIAKYEGQQANVRNNKEFENFAKEIEFQQLEIQLAEKKSKEYQGRIKERKELISQTRQQIADRQIDLNLKKEELAEIVGETNIEEANLRKQSEAYESIIEQRLYQVYQRLRKNTRNGLAVVEINRDACGGCFNKIPPQRQVDIKLNKKIVVCEYCGRILVDLSLEDTEME